MKQRRTCNHLKSKNFLVNNNYILKRFGEESFSEFHHYPNPGIPELFRNTDKKK